MEHKILKKEKIVNVKISIIVPVYNVSQYLSKCLDSLLSQTLEDIEIICINDSSTDDSLEILEKYAEKDKRIKIINREENGGLSAARNTGIHHSSAKYIMFCDSDDYYDKKMCGIMLDTVEKKNVDLVACGTYIEYIAHDEMKESDENYYRIKYSGYNLINDEIILKTDVSVCNKIFRKDILDQYGIEFPKGLNNEDFYFYNTYMSVCKSIYFINQKLYHYVRRDNSIMSKNFKKETLSNDHLIIAEKIFKFFKINKILEEKTNLFWKLWIDSYWFSYFHSSKKYHKQIHSQAKKFIISNFNKFPPTSPKTRNQVLIIKKNSIFYKIRNKISRIKNNSIFRKILCKVRIISKAV